MNSVRCVVFLIVVLMAVIAIVPTVRADERNITINVTFPEEGDTLYLDVAPAFVSVQWNNRCSARYKECINHKW